MGDGVCAGGLLIESRIEIPVTAGIWKALEEKTANPTIAGRRSLILLAIALSEYNPVSGKKTKKEKVVGNV